MINWTKILEFTESTSQRVGKQLLQDFGTVQAYDKSDGSLVTQSDKWADKEIREAIAQAFPDHGILSEENNNVFPDKEWCWIVDPIDGTTNFTRGVPIWSISIGLLYKNTPVFGYIYVPTLNEAYHGFWKGSCDIELPTGAFRNHHPIHTSNDEASKNHFFNLCVRSISVIQKGFPCKIRMLGSATYNLLMVAAGAAVGGVEATPKVWDLAAVWVIVQAAGGTWVSLKSQPFPLIPGDDYSGRSFPTLVVSRSELIDTFTPFLQEL
jgi:myo-inositol-1(or 4)-monophosphatase